MGLTPGYDRARQQSCHREGRCVKKSSAVPRSWCRCHEVHTDRRHEDRGGAGEREADLHRGPMLRPLRVLASNRRTFSEPCRRGPFPGTRTRSGSSSWQMGYCRGRRPCSSRHQRFKAGFIASSSVRATPWVASGVSRSCRTASAWFPMRSPESCQFTARTYGAERVHVRSHVRQPGEELGADLRGLALARPRAAMRATGMSSPTPPG